MIRFPAIINASVAEIKKASDITVQDYRDALIEDEVAFTNRLVSNIQARLDGFNVKGVRWYSKVLTDHGKNAQERTHGADFVGILAIDIDGYQVAKGFLAQAKRTHINGRIDDLRRMSEQCETMLQRSPASYVFLYSREGVRVAPAISVVGSERFEANGSYTRDISSFYKDHFECFAGDRRLVPPSLLESARTELAAAPTENLPLGKRIIQRLEALAKNGEDAASLLEDFNTRTLLALVATDENE